MGLFSLIKRIFRRKEELPSLPELEKPVEILERPSFLSEPSIDTENIQKYLELINTKLDLTNERLKSLDRRLEELEKLAKESK